jgi:hypothetical protein
MWLSFTMSVRIKIKKKIFQRTQKHNWQIQRLKNQNQIQKFIYNNQDTYVTRLIVDPTILYQLAKPDH